MEIRDLLENVISDNQKFETYYFEDEDDATRTIGGHMLCGHVEDNQSYLIAMEPFYNERCDAVIYEYGDYHFLYKIEM